MIYRKIRKNPGLGLNPLTNKAALDTHRVHKPLLEQVFREDYVHVNTLALSHN